MSLFYLNQSARACIECADGKPLSELPAGYTGPHTRADFDAWRTALPESQQSAETPVPEAVSAAAFGSALIDFGILPSAVIATIEQIADVTLREHALWLFTRSATFERQNPTLVSLASSVFGLTDAQLDALFISARKRE